MKILNATSSAAKKSVLLSDGGFISMAEAMKRVAKVLIFGVQKKRMHY